MGYARARVPKDRVGRSQSRFGGAHQAKTRAGAGSSREPREQRMTTPARSTKVARTGEAQLQGSMLIRSRRSGAPVPTRTAASTVSDMAPEMVRAALRASSWPRPVTRTLRKAAAPRRRARGVARRSSRKRTRAKSLVESMSPVARPRMTTAEVWPPALPAVPVSVVRKRARRRLRWRRAAKRLRTMEERLWSMRRERSQEARLRTTARASAAK
mmetsp:Transcript_22276/g.69743  ORF Transcript_22276/g.69743 Transcript_22276/m.69743 type:complete len:214 (+) Transcript_22276:3-644(+)